MIKLQKLSDTRAAADYLRKSLDIIQVITDDLGPAPKKSGLDHVWCCPIHGETGPSFYVHTQTQIYKCFPPGTIVNTSNGRMPIESIPVGTEVITHTGTTKRVYDILVNNHSGYLIDIKTYKTQTTVSSTPEHPYYVYDSILGQTVWKEAQKLTQNDFIKISVDSKIEDVDSIDADKVIPGYLNARINTSKYAKIDVPGTIKIDEDLCLLSGYYLSEGYIGQRRGKKTFVGFAFNKNETKYIEDVKRLSKSIFNIQCGSHTVNNTTYVYMCSTPVAILFDALFGHLAHKKRIPTYIKNLPYNKIEQLLIGIFRGDGTLSKNTKKRGYLARLTMVSEDVIRNVWEILIKHDIPASLTRGKVPNGGNHHIWNCAVYTPTQFLHKTWNKKVPTVSNSRKSDKYRIIDGSLFYRVKDKNRRIYNGKVYNLEVEDDHSYTVGDSLACHNCFGCGIGGDVVRWEQVYNNLQTHEAILSLANKYNIDLSTYLRPPTPEELQEQRYKYICNKAAEFCNKQLLDNKTILQWYLTDTGFNIENIIDYEVGYSQSPDSIVQHLFNTIPNLSQNEVDRLEFVGKMMWNNALVYPVKDESGDTIRFYNKPLSPPPDWGGKYIGTSTNHPLFRHGLLFGFNLIKKNLKNLKYVKIVEGQKAAIASGGAALLGSSIHEEQIRLLQAHNIKEIRIAFDGDEAGRAASIKLLDRIDLMTNMHVLVAKLPEGKQPDDILRSDGKDALNKYFDDAKLPIQFFIDYRSNKEGVLSTQDKFALIHEIKSYLSSLPPLHFDINAKYLSNILEVDVDSIKSYISELKATQSTLINRDTELAVIRYLLMNPRSWSTARQAIPEYKVFTVSAYQHAWGAMDSVHAKSRNKSGADSVTPQTVKDELSVLFPQFKDLPKVVDTILSTDPKYEFIDALQRVVDLYRRRTGIEQSKIFSGFLQDLGQDTNDLVSKYRRQLVSSMDIRKDDINGPLDLAERVEKEIDERMRRKTSIVGFDFSQIIDVDGQKIPCLTGLTLSLSGIQKKHQIIISANTGVGKSLLGLQIAVSLSICPIPEEQVPVLWLPLEMNAEETTFRIISMITGINNDKVQTGLLTSEEYLKVKEALNKIASSQFYIRKPRYGHSDELFSIVDEHKFKHGIQVVITDYIQLVSHGPSDRGLARWEVIGKASKMFKNQIAEGMDVASICIAQLNRKDYKAGEAGKTEGVGGSYEISQDADDFMSIAAKDDQQVIEEKNMRGNRMIFLDKRRGGTSDVTIHADVDTNLTKNLRFVEKMPAEQMMGLLKGIKT